MNARRWGLALLTTAAIAIVVSLVRYDGGVGPIPGAVLLADGILLLLCGLAALRNR